MAITPETALTEAEVDSVREEARQVMAAEGLSQAAAARQAGVAAATYAAWLTGTYQGRSDRVAGQVQIWLSSRRERQRSASALPQAPAFVATRTAGRVHEVLQWAQMGPDLVVVAGGAGIGKTTACQHYAGKNPNVWLATMQPTTASTHTMLLAVAEAVGVAEKSASRLAPAIGARVGDRDGLLIVDEAQHLRAPALDQLRSLHDLHGVGIALIGNESVYARLEGGEGRRPEFAQLYSRVGMRFTRPKPYGADICELIRAWGVEDAAAVRLLQIVAEKPGALRGLTKTLRLASMLATGAGEALGVTHVQAAWTRLSDTGADRAAA